MAKSRKKMPIGSFHSISLEQIKQGDNSRLVYEEKGIAELMISMKQNGLQQPIGIRELEDGYELVFGFRRFAAAQKLGWKTVDCITVEAKTDEQSIVLNAVENMQREDVPPAEQGRLFQRLIDENKLTPEQIAARVGKPVRLVRNCLSVYGTVPRKGVRVLSASNRTEEGVAQSAAFAVAGVIRRFGLTGKQRDDLYQFAARKGVTLSHVKAAGHMIAEGKTLGEAIGGASKQTIVTISLLLPSDKVEALEEKDGRSIHAILKERIEKMPDIGAITRTGKYKHTARRPRTGRYGELSA